MIVRVQRLAEPSLLAWARSLAADPAEALALDDLYYETIERELMRTNGRPEPAIRVPGIERKRGSGTSRRVGTGSSMRFVGEPNAGGSADCCGHRSQKWSSWGSKTEPRRQPTSHG